MFLTHLNFFNSFNTTLKENDNTYPTPKKENTAGVEISEADNLNKDIEARANAFINETYAKEQEAMKEQRALQAIKAQAQAKKEASQTQGITEEIKGKGFTAQNPQNVTEPLVVESPTHSTLLQTQDKAGALAHSPKDNAIIPQSPNALQALEQYVPNLADAARLNNLNKDLQELAHNFKIGNTDKENAKLFDRVLIVAQQLGVKAKASTTKQGVLGSFNSKTNTIEIFTKDKAKQSETILHELIHATTLKALRADEKLLTPLQKDAIKEIKDAYNILSKDTRLKGEYGLSSVEEMLAELSNKTFRDKLENKGILRKILDASICRRDSFLW